MLSDHLGIDARAGAARITQEAGGGDHAKACANEGGDVLMAIANRRGELEARIKKGKPRRAARNAGQRLRRTPNTDVLRIDDRTPIESTTSETLAVTSGRAFTRNVCAVES